MGHYDSSRDYDYEKQKEGLISRITEELETKSVNELYTIESIVLNVDSIRKVVNMFNKL